jgi:hypothetical protein
MPYQVQLDRWFFAEGQELFALAEEVSRPLENMG